MKATMTKEVFLSGVLCPTYGWLTRHSKSPNPSPGAALCPDIADDLLSLLGALVDLEKIVKHVDHSDFRGRTSIKKVLPVLVPGFSYDDLDVGDGALARGSERARGLKRSP